MGLLDGAAIGAGADAFMDAYGLSRGIQQRDKRIAQQKRYQQQMMDYRQQLMKQQQDQIQRQQMIEDRKRKANAMLLGGGLLGDAGPNGRTPGEMATKHGGYNPLEYVDPKTVAAMQPEPPKMAPGVREFMQVHGRAPKDAREYLSFHQGMKGPGVTVNTGDGPQLGSIPKGYQAVQDEKGNWTMQPVPGGPAEREIEAGKQAAQNKEAMTRRYADVVVEDIDRVGDLLDEAWIPATGAGSVTSYIPGTTAHDTSKLLDTIRANVGFDRLQQMRDASPTGGALGQVSEFENRLLQSTLGNLEMSQTEEQFRYNLGRLRRTYLDIIHGPGNWDTEAPGVKGGKQPRQPGPGTPSVMRFDKNGNPVE